MKITPRFSGWLATDERLRSEIGLPGKVPNLHAGQPVIKGRLLWRRGGLLLLTAPPSVQFAAEEALVAGISAGKAAGSLGALDGLRALRFDGLPDGGAEGQLLGSA